MKLKKNDLIAITWEDITQHYEWVDEDIAAAKQTTTCWVTGYYLNEDKNCLRLSDMVNTNKERNVTVLPKGCIKKIFRLRKSK